MYTAQDAAGGSGSPQDVGPRNWAGPAWRGRGCGPAARWSPFEIAAMVLGFMVFWPIGLAILAYKVWQGKAGYPRDLQTVAQGKWRDMRSAMSANTWSPPGAWTSNAWSGRTSSYGGNTGNSAFDAWKASEIDRLEAERRKLQEAHREFSDFVDTVRKAKDREEFDRFMAERRNRPAEPSASH